MGIEIAKAFVTIRADSSSLRSDMQKAKNVAERGAARVADSIASHMARIGAAIGAGLFARMAIRSAAALEQQRLAFETMLGSAEQAEDLIKRLTEFAARTPFQLPGIIATARGLVTFGESADSVMDTLKILGNAAAATGTPMEELGLIFNQVRGVGKLLTQDFRQLAMRGVISLKDIADHFGVTTAAAQQMMTAGEISFADLREILTKLSSDGGRFANLMEKQSRSLGGVISTLKDNFEAFARSVGEAVSPALRSVVRFMTNLAQLVASAIKSHPVLTRLIVEFGVALGTVVVALKAFAAAMAFAKALAGPAGWAQIAVGIGVATAAVVAMEATLAAAGSRTDELKDKTERVGGAAAKAETGVQRLGRAFEAANGAVDQLAKSADAIARAAGLRMAPTVETDVGPAVAAIDALNEKIFGLRMEARRGKIEVEGLSDAAQAIAATEAIGALSKMEDEFRRLAKLPGRIGEAYGRMADAARDAIDAATRRLINLSIAFGEGKIGSEQLLTALREISAALRAAQGEIQAADDALRVAVGPFGSVAAAIEEAKRAVEETMTPLERYNAEMARLTELFKVGAISEEVFSRAKVQKLRELLAATEEEGEKAAEILDRLASELESLTTTPAERTISELEELGATKEQLEEAIELLGKIDEAKRKKGLADAVRSIIDSAKGPMDRLKEQIDEILEAARTGAVSTEEAMKALEVLRERQAEQVPEVRGALGGITGRIGVAELGQRIQEALLQPQDRNLEEARRQTKMLQAINDGIARLNETTEKKSEPARLG